MIDVPVFEVHYINRGGCRMWLLVRTMSRTWIRQSVQ